jgi:hypothetical protein
MVGASTAHVDERKFDALVHYVCARSGDPARLGATKLNKILWFADVIAYVRTGHPITGAIYVKRQFGPVPRGIMASRSRLRANGKIFEKKELVGTYEQIQFISLQEPDLSPFRAEEISLVDEVIDIICNSHTARSISDLTHDNVWKMAEIGEEIPLHAMLAAQRVEIDESDIEWAMKEIGRIEQRAA